MATILDNPYCATNTGNVGTPSCAIGIENLRGLILTEDSFKLTVAQLATWPLTLAALKTATLAAVGSRIYPLTDVVGLTDNTPAPEAKSSGYGIVTKIVEKPHSFEIDYKDLGGKFFKELRTFRNRKDLRAFWIDNTFIGGETNSAGEFMGFKVSFQPKQIKVGTVADITKYPIQLDLTDPTSLTDKLVAITIPTDVTLATELMGILNVNLALIGTAAATSAKVTVITEISKTNLYDEYSGATQLGAVAAWVAVNSVTAAVVTITGVTAVPATKSFTLAYATQTDPVLITLAAPAVLAATPLFIGGNGTSGFESDSVTAPVA